MDTEFLKKLILKKLIRANIWGGKHTPIDFIIKGLPEHYHNTHKGKKIIEKTFKELANNNWIIILAKKTRKGSGSHVSLNPRKIGEIKTFLGEV